MTEVGEIPVDWEVVPMNEIATVSSGKRLPLGYYVTDNPTPHPYIRVADMYMGGVSLDNIKYVPEAAFPLIKNYRIYSEDLFISVAGTLGIVGKVPLTLNGANLTENANKITPVCDQDYLLAVLTSDYIQNTIKSEATLGAQPKLALVRIRNFQIPLPPTLAEQTAIATALSDADGLIRGLEAVIAKKRAIKEGVMGELLRPKVGWVETPFGNVSWFQEGPGVRKWQFTKSGVKLLNGTNIQDGNLDLSKTNRNISEQTAYGMYSHFLVEDGDILIACSGITIDKFHEKVTIARDVDLPLCMNTSTMRFKVTSNELSKSYLLHYLRSKRFKVQIGGSATGSAQLNFGPSHVSEAFINLPSIDEQVRIGSILDNLDSELTTLTTKLAKARQLKAGMMGDLLTGRVRLV